VLIGAPDSANRANNLVRRAVRRLDLEVATAIQRRDLVVNVPAMFAINHRKLDHRSDVIEKKISTARQPTSA